MIITTFVFTPPSLAHAHTMMRASHVLLLWFSACTITLSNCADFTEFVNSPRTVCQTPQRIFCQNTNTSSNTNYIELLGIYGNVPCSSLKVQGFNTDDNVCGGGSTAVRVQFLVNIDLTNGGDACFVTIPIDFVSKDPNFPACSISECDSSKCDLLTNRISLTFDVSNFIYERRVQLGYNSWTIPFEYIQFTRNKSPIEYDSTAEDTEYPSKNKRCDTDCSSSTDDCRWRAGYSRTFHPYCSEAQTFQEGYSWSRSICYDDVPQVYRPNSDTDRSRSKAQCNSDRRGDNRHIFPGITPLELMMLYKNTLGQTSGSLVKMSDGVANPNPLNSPVTSLNAISSLCLGSSITNIDNTIEYYNRSTSLSPISAGDNGGTWFPPSFSFFRWLSNSSWRSTTTSLTGLDCGYCGKLNPQFADSKCKKDGKLRDILIAYRNWVLGISPYCFIGTVDNTCRSFYNAELKVRVENTAGNTLSLSINNGSFAQTTRVISEGGGIYLQLGPSSSGGAENNIVPDPLGETSPKIMACAASLDKFYETFNMEPRPYSNPYRGRFNPITGEPNCANCMPDEQFSSTIPSLWWFIDQSQYSKYFVSKANGAECERMPLNDLVYRTDDCDNVPFPVVNTTGCKKKPPPGIQSSICYTDPAEIQMCRPPVTMCSITGLYRNFRDMLRQYVTNQIGYPSMSPDLTSALPPIWNSDFPNVWFETLATNVSSKIVYTPVLRYQFGAPNSGNTGTTSQSTKSSNTRASFQYTVLLGASIVQQVQTVPAVTLRQYSFPTICNMATTKNLTLTGTATIGFAIEPPPVSSAEYTAVATLVGATCTFNGPIVVTARQATPNAMFTCSNPTSFVKSQDNIEVQFFFKGLLLSTGVTMCGCCRQCSTFDSNNPVCGKSSTCPCSAAQPTVPTASTPPLPTSGPVPTKTDRDNIPSDVLNNNNAIPETTDNETEIANYYQESEAAEPTSTLIYGIIVLSTIGGIVLVVVIAVVIYCTIEKKKEKEEDQSFSSPSQ